MTGTRISMHPPIDREFVSGCKMPSSYTIMAGDTLRRQDAEYGSERLLAAIQRYFARGGRG